MLSSYGLPTQPARKSTILALVELAVNEYYYNKSTGVTIRLEKLVAFPAFPTKIATHHKGFVGGMLHLEDCRSKKQAEEDEARQIIPIHLAGGASTPPGRTTDAPVGAVNSCKVATPFWRFPTKLAGGSIGSKFHNWISIFIYQHFWQILNTALSCLQIRLQTPQPAYKHLSLLQALPEYTNDDSTDSVPPGCLF